jgi:hypothetical protein
MQPLHKQLVVHNNSNNDNESCFQLSIYVATWLFVIVDLMIKECIYHVQISFNISWLIFIKQFVLVHHEY